MRGVYDYTIYRAMMVGRRLLAFVIALLLIVSFSGDAIAAEVKSDTENAIRLTGGRGTITVTDSKGKKSKVTTKMRLDNGSLVTTSSKSYATVKLDSTKYIKLDSLTKAEVRKANGKAEVLLNSGNLFFNVTSALSENEIFNIRTSSMVMSVKGTCAQVEVLDSRHTRVCLLEGSLNCKITSLKSGESKTVILLAGQAADFYLTGSDTNDCKIVTEEITTDSIRGFVLEELLNDKSLSNTIFQQSGLDFRSLTKDMVDSRIKREQSSKGVAKEKAKNNTRKSIELDFLEDHEEGRLTYTTEGLVTIIPEAVSEEHIAQNNPYSSEQQGGDSPNPENGKQRTMIREIGNTVSGRLPAGEGDITPIPSPRAVVVFKAYVDG